MKIAYPGKNSLLWRILLSTSLAVTAVFAITGWMVQHYAASVSQRSLEQEVRTSLEAYQSLWRTRVHNLAATSRLISSMPDVRAAFMIHDRATIRDVAEQLWAKISEQDARFLVLDPTGETITSLGGDPNFSLDPKTVEAARAQFPRQVAGYFSRRGELFYVVLTPVYVQAQRGEGLINILLVALDIN